MGRKEEPRKKIIRWDHQGINMGDDAAAA